MISRIDSISNFGIYKNFNWNSISSIEEFKAKNIIYGWNYSGKTTFSKIFSSLRDKLIDKDFPNGNFKITTDRGNFDKSNITTFPYNVLVFNSDYIKENLRWDFDNDINAIFFEVGDNAKHTLRIEVLEKLIIEIEGTDTTIGKKSKFKKVLEDYSHFENSIFTDEARKIQNDHFISLIKFNKADLRKVKDQIISEIDTHIIKDNKTINKISKVIKIEEPKPTIGSVSFIDKYIDIEKNTNEILETSPIKSEVIEILDKSNDAYNWVRSGLVLNKGSESCLFCNNPITDDRIRLLNNYFENQASKLKVKCKMVFEQIKAEEENLNAINFPLSLNDFNEGFQEDFKNAKKQIDKLLLAYSKHLQNVRKKLANKIESNIYSALPQIDEFNTKEIIEKIEALNIIIKNNNEFSINFPIIIQLERDKYKRHLVALFLKASKYLTKEKKVEKALIEIEKLDKKTKEYKNEIDRLNALKQSDAEGCAQFNSFVQSFLSREDIEIKLNEQTKKFNLLRGTELAKNLSEGEKTAISFSHFLVTLKGIQQKNELKDYIIFIDDPISSLDGNHIFQINSLLKEIFFDKVASTNPNQKDLVKIVKCKQLFISTHNFEFFNLLKELPIAKSNESRYFISRQISESIIEKLPNVYDTYASEYHFLFSEIDAFNNDINKATSSKLLLMPNILRRFVEMYTLTQYPSADELDGRADIVFGKVFSKRICKPFHYFSHFNNIDRIGKQSELIADVSSACSTLLKYLDEKQDNKHYQALKKAIS